MIQVIVEGDGEIAAVPILLRRLLAEFGIYDVAVGKPLHATRSQIVREADIHKFVRLAKAREKTQAILILFDLDDDCARDHIPKLLDWASAEAPPCSYAVVMARREYEAWLIASLESLRGVRGVSETAYYADDPEVKRDAKGIISSVMPGNSKYAPTSDQAALTNVFDLKLAYQRASSFRKLVKELCRILTELGHEPVIPDDWNAEIKQHHEN